MGWNSILFQVIKTYRFLQHFLNLLLILILSSTYRHYLFTSNIIKLQKKNRALKSLKFLIVWKVDKLRKMTPPNFRSIRDIISEHFIFYKKNKTILEESTFWEKYLRKVEIEVSFFPSPLSSSSVQRPPGAKLLWLA